MTGIRQGVCRLSKLEAFRTYHEDLSLCVVDIGSGFKWLTLA